MARPKKADDEKLVQAKTSLRPDRFDELDKEARTRGVELAVVLREKLDPRFRVRKTT